MQRAQHLDGAIVGARQFGRDVGGDAGQAQHLDVQRLARAPRGLEVGAAVVPQAEIEPLAGRPTA